MSEPHKIHCYARVARSFESVRAILHDLRDGRGPEAPLSVHSIHDQRAEAGLPDHTRATLGVRDEHPLDSRHLASAELYASSLSPFDTEIEIEAHCVDRPHGSMDDSARRAADAHVHALLESIVARFRGDLGLGPREGGGAPWSPFPGKQG